MARTSGADMVGRRIRSQGSTGHTSADCRLAADTLAALQGRRQPV